MATKKLKTTQVNLTITANIKMDQNKVSDYAQMMISSVVAISWAKSSLLTKEEHRMWQEISAAVDEGFLKWTMPHEQSQLFTFPFECSDLRRLRSFLSVIDDVTESGLHLTMEQRFQVEELLKEPDVSACGKALHSKLKGLDNFREAEELQHDINTLKRLAMKFNVTLPESLV